MLFSIIPYAKHHLPSSAHPLTPGKGYVCGQGRSQDLVSGGASTNPESIKVPLVILYGARQLSGGLPPPLPPPPSWLRLWSLRFAAHLPLTHPRTQTDSFIGYSIAGSIISSKFMHPQDL